MVRKCLFSVLLLVLSVAAFAQTSTQGATSEYSNGAYHTKVYYEVDASYSKLCGVLDQIYAGFIEGHPTKNLKWLWKNLGNHDNVQEDMVMHEKGLTFNKADGSYLLKMEIALKRADAPTAYDIVGFLKSKKTSGATAKKNVSLSVTKKIKILNTANFSITAVQLKGNKSGLYVDSDLEFSKLVSLLFSTNRYRSIMEWRIQGVAMNIKKKAEGDTSRNY